MTRKYIKRSKGNGEVQDNVVANVAAGEGIVLTDVPDNKSVDELNIQPVDYNTAPDDYTLNIISDRNASSDVFRIPNPDKNYRYRFIRDEQKNISRKTGNLLHHNGGWQFCPKAHLLRIGFKQQDIAPDGLRRVGDTMLAFMPVELWMEKEAEKIRKNNAPMEAVRKMVKEGDKSNFKDIHPSMKGIQTAKKLGFSSSDD